jgi:tripartite-type tricarboxylate transporter receptor subunit TctC
MVPKNTPAPVIETLNREVNKALVSPEMKEPLTRLGVVPVGGPPSAFKAKIDSDYKAHGTLIRELNIQPE